MDQKSMPIEVLNFPSSVSLIEEDYPKLERQTKWLSRQALQLASFRIKYEEIRIYAQGLQQEVKQLRQNNQQLFSRLKVFDQQARDSSAKVVDLEQSQKDLHNQLLKLQSQKAVLIKEIESLRDVKFDIAAKQTSIKYLSKMCLRLAKQKYDYQVTRQETESILKLVKKGKTQNKLLKERLISIQKSFKEFEVKYHKKNEELNQLTDKFISLQQRNYELVKELEEKDNNS